MMRRSLFAILASLLAAVTFIGLNLAAWNWLAPARIDFTQNRLYTLSDSARRVVGRLVEPVELELVYSRASGAALPAVRAHAERVRELLNEIAARGDGKVRIRETDPAPFSEEEDRVMSAGLTPAPVDGGDPVYFGVIGRNSVDDIVVIPFLSPERDAMLEYDLVRLIAQLDDPAPRRIAVLSSLPAWRSNGSDETAPFILSEMSRAFEVEFVDSDFKALPRGTDIVALIHPPPLSEWQAYVIDQALLRGGRALIAVDPLSRAALASGDPRLAPASGLGRLEKTLGVRVASDEIVADPTLGLPVAMNAGGGRQTVETQPLFMAVPRALMSDEDPVTADLTRAVNFGLAGAILATPVSGVETETLIETTKTANVVPSDFAASNPAPRDVVGRLGEDGASRVLAMRISGELRSAFSAPPPVPAPPEGGRAALDIEARERVEPFVSRSQTPAEIVLLADSDAFDDAFYIDPESGTTLGGNAAFILNALDHLAGDEALMALRSRAPAARPMKRVDELRAAARQRLYQEQQRLESLLADAEARLKALESGRPQGAARSAEELAEIDRFRAEASAIRLQLRGVERAFRRDVDALARRLELLNIWLPPAIVALIGAGVFAWRSRNRERRA